ncbi:MAG TPA: carbohydrate kinase [Chitinophagales bacterium]|nr:carbohydrate kinase [Chitinophagales bacterium]
MPPNSSICCFGEVLWDLLPEGKKLGGAPMNVAAHLQQLGLPSLMISRVGSDDLGKEIRAWMKEKNFSAEWIQTDEVHTTGIVNVDLTDKNQVTYDIVQPAAWDFVEHNILLSDLIENSLGIVFGTLALRSEVSRKCLFQLLDKAKLKIFDVNLRSPHYSRELVELLLQRADIVKMNDDELSLIASWFNLQHSSNKERMTQLKKLFTIQLLLVTRGANGAMVLNDTGFYESAGFKVKVADTIGSGDSFLAGFLKKYLDGKPVHEALNYACAVGATVATHHGAIPMISEEEVAALMEQ